MKKILILVTVSTLALGACQKAAAPVATVAAVSEDEAAKLFDGTVEVWQSMDAAKIKGIYAPDVAGFDVAAPDLVIDRAAWDKNQDAFAASKLDSVKVRSKKIQMLDADNFIVNSVSDGTSTAVPANKFTFRCTDVYHRAAGGTFSIVNEHCSGVPKA